MNARLLKFLLCSICLHVALFLIPFHAGQFEHGIARTGANESSALKIRIVANARKESPRLSEAQKVINTFSEQTPSVPNYPEKNHTKTAAGTRDSNTLPPPSTDDYFSTGQLTRPPIPLIPIDLNGDDITGVGYFGETKLIVLVDVDGSVTDVLASAEEDFSRDFVKLVAARFKEARFRPGEIEGRAVKSQLTITVVSANADTPGNSNPPPDRLK